VPLLYLPHDDDQIVVVASRGGMSSHPAWCLNLMADPRATVEFGSRRRIDTSTPTSNAPTASFRCCSSLRRPIPSRAEDHRCGRRGVPGDEPHPAEPVVDEVVGVVRARGQLGARRLPQAM
jgi:F420H(2)-dependent quinone reductase